MMTCSACGAKFEAPVQGACPSCGALFANALPDGGTQVPGAPREARAGFWIRFLAHAVDIVIVGVAGYILSLVGLKRVESYAVSLCINAAYYIGLTATSGQTLGKRLIGIKVVMLDGSDAGWGASALRWIGYALSGLPLALGYAWVGFTKPRRAWHDIVARTKVVYIDPAAAASGQSYTPEDDRVTPAVIAVMVLAPLLFLAAIVAIAFIAFSALGGMPKLAGEGAGKGSLGAIRSALAIYYGDMEGQYPTELDALTVGGKYLVVLPVAKTPPLHPDSNRVYGFPSRSQASSSDSGGWAYVNNPQDPDFGSVWVDCTHQDSKGTVWNAY
ncbi:MAG: RDD family protein [Elusimicrobia bacterium]|nr:RDD family protein [Elusimicrobiota bacterium]